MHWLGRIVTEEWKGVSGHTLDWKPWLQLFTPLHCLLAEEAALQLIDEGAEGDEGALLFVAGERTTAGVERTEAVAEHHGEGQADVADMIDFSLKGMEALSVDPYFDFVLFFMVVMF